jgi:hypothetical protein
MSVITYFIPYVFLFLATLRLQREPAGPEVLRLPGGRWTAIVLASIGLFSTIVTIGLSIVPEDDEPNKPLAILKVVGMTVVLIAAGMGTYAWGKRQQRRKTIAG